MKLDKKLLDDFIRITNKYQKTGDVDILDKKFSIQSELLINIKYPTNNISDVIYDLCNMRLTYKKIYEVLNILGFEVVENVD